jgi:hypothetical protein
VKQYDSHITTAQDKITPLKITIENGMGKLKREGHCVLSACKYNVIVDAAATGLTMQGKAYTKEKNQKSWVSADYLDEGSWTCPDINAIMALTNINFVKDPELHSLILNTAVDILREGYQTGGAISEGFSMKVMGTHLIKMSLAKFGIYQEHQKFMQDQSHCTPRFKWMPRERQSKISSRKCSRSRIYCLSMLRTF